MTDVHIPTELLDDDSSGIPIETQRTLIDAYMRANSSTGSVASLQNLLAADVVADYPSKRLEGRDALLAHVRRTTALVRRGFSRNVVSRCSEPTVDDEGFVVVRWKLDARMKTKTLVVTCGGCCGLLSRKLQSATGKNRYLFSNDEEGNWRILFIETRVD